MQGKTQTNLSIMKHSVVLVALMAMFATSISVWAQTPQRMLKGMDIDPCKCPLEQRQAELKAMKEDIAYFEELNLHLDSAARFRGGETALRDYTLSRQSYLAKTLRDSVYNTVLYRFIVERNGKITNIVRMTHSDPLFEREGDRFIRTMPRWKPALAKGKEVRSWMLLRLYFSYPNPNDSIVMDSIPQWKEVLDFEQTEAEMIEDIEENGDSFHLSEEMKQAIEAVKNEQ